MTAAAQIALEGEPIIPGPRDGRARILHTTKRIADIDRALRFYVEGLGMTELQRTEIPARRVTSIFVGFPGEDTGAPVQFEKAWDADADYSHGTGYGHVAVGTADVPALFARMQALGAGVIMAPDVLVPGGPCCAFIRDPDGYAVEIVQNLRPGRPADQDGEIG